MNQIAFQFWVLCLLAVVAVAASVSAIIDYQVAKDVTAVTTEMQKTVRSN